MTKYQKIYEIIKERISSGEYPAKSCLPSEQELMSEFEASRDTVRKALAELSNNKYILKVKGKGSVVLENNPISFPVSGLISFKELQNGSEHPATTDLRQFETIEADDHLAKQLNVKPGTPILKIERVRAYNKERVIIDTDYINPAIIEGLTPEQAKNSIFEYIENTLGMPISFARKEITVVPATAHDRSLLDMEDYDLLVLVRSYNYLEDATLFQYTESRHRPDKFRFVDFSRREK